MFFLVSIFQWQVVVNLPRYSTLADREIISLWMRSLPTLAIRAIKEADYQVSAKRTMGHDNFSVQVSEILAYYQCNGHRLVHDFFSKLVWSF